MFETLKNKYSKGFIRKNQLEKYVALGVITSEELNLILSTFENK